MKKALKWFVVLLIATLISGAMKEKMTPKNAYMTTTEAQSHSQKVGYVTAVIYGIAFFAGHIWTKTGEPQQSEDDGDKIVFPAPEIDEHNSLNPIAGESGIGECPRCKERMSMDRESCFNCGLVFGKRL